MFTYTMTNKESGVSVTSNEMTKEQAEKLVEMGKKHDKENQIDFVINSPATEEKAEELHQKIQAIQNNPESKEGAEGIYIFNKKAIKKMEKLSWQMYWLTSAQRTTPYNKADYRPMFW